jgi:hypothetical protein
VTNFFLVILALTFLPGLSTLVHSRESLQTPGVIRGRRRFKERLALRQSRFRLIKVLLGQRSLDQLIDRDSLHQVGSEVSCRCRYRVWTIRHRVNQSSPLSLSFPIRFHFFEVNLSLTRVGKPTIFGPDVV